jgi:hypothetical protein
LGHSERYSLSKIIFKTKLPATVAQNGQNLVENKLIEINQVLIKNTKTFTMGRFFTNYKKKIFSQEEFLECKLSVKMKI